MRSKSRPWRARGLGNAGRALAKEAQCKLTAADRRLQPLYDDNTLNPQEVRETANAVGRLISNAAKLISDLLGLGTAGDENGETK